MDRRAVTGLLVALAAAASAVAATRWHLVALASVAAVASVASAALWLHQVLQPRQLRQLRDDPRPPDPPAGPDSAPVGEDEIEGSLAAKLAVAKRHLWPITVVQLSLSRLGGDPPGEEAWAELSDLIRATLRASDMAAEPLGGRFLVVLDDTGEQGGIWAVERLQETLETRIANPPRIIAGLATYPTHALDAASLLSLSAQALQRALEPGQAASGNTAHVQVARAEPR